MADITVVRQTTNTFPVTFTNNGGVIDITGWIVFFTVKKYLSQTDDEAVISKTNTVHTNAAAGITTFELTPEDTTLSPGVNYFWDIAFIDDEGDRKSFNPGNFNVIGNVTRRDE